MSNSLHPHWDTTDNEELPVRITDAGSSKKTAAAVAVPRATRSPAAIVGVGLFLAAGTALFMGANGLLGQLSSDDIKVTITQDGIEPSVVTALPGETITWKNEAAIPHILRSKTLPTEDGEAFNTTAIFPQAEYSYTVPLTAIAGMHDYISGTAENITGQIIIDQDTQATVPLAETSTESETPMAVISAESSSSESVSNTIEYSNTSAASVAQSSSAASVYSQVPLSGVIPQNPNIVGSGNNPLPPRQQVPGTTKSASSEPLRPGAPVTQHMPTANAQTGMELWVLAVITVASFAGVAWKAARNS